MNEDIAISGEGLIKKFGDTVALDGLNLSAKRGSVLGVLGPNGAGKTTAVRILSTLLQPDSGVATVAGIDVVKHPDQVRERIGLTGQSAAVDEHLTAIENLEMFGRLYGLRKAEARARGYELLEQFGLTDAADKVSKNFSGGMRRRLDLAAGLVYRPEIIFLDEPTTGLDPRSRNQMWDVIRDLVSQGATLLLTTQYLEEADALADLITVIDRGTNIATGTANELKKKVGGERIEVVIEEGANLEDVRSILARHGNGEVVVDAPTNTLSVSVVNEKGKIAAIAKDLEADDIHFHDFGLRRPTLDEVFLTLTGRSSSENELVDTNENELKTNKKEVAK